MLTMAAHLVAICHQIICANGIVCVGCVFTVARCTCVHHTVSRLVRMLESHVRGRKADLLVTRVFLKRAAAAPLRQVGTRVALHKSSGQPASSEHTQQQHHMLRIRGEDIALHNVQQLHQDNPSRCP
jgi:hypothetical protein